MKGTRKFNVTEHIFVKSDKSREYIQVGFEMFFCPHDIYILPEKYEEKKGIYYTIEEIADKYGFIRNRTNRDEVFFVLCSNLQAWVENDYNSDLYIYNMAFPILKELVKLKVDKSEYFISSEVLRKMSGHYFPVKKYLINGNYLSYLDSAQIQEFLNNHYDQFLFELENNSEMNEVQKFVLHFELLSQCHSREHSVDIIDKISLIVKDGFNTGEYGIFFYLMAKAPFFDPYLYFAEEEEYWSFFMGVNEQFFRDVLDSTGLVVEYEWGDPTDENLEIIKLHSINLLESLKIKNFSDAMGLQIRLKELKEKGKDLRDIKETHGVKLLNSLVYWVKSNEYY